MKHSFGAVVLFIAFFALSTTLVHAAPPANFQTTQIIGSGLTGPTGFDIAPDGRIFILQRTGEVMVYKNNALLAQPFVVLPSAASGDRGLIGIAFDPDYYINHYVYFYYTGTDLFNHLVRFDASADTATGPATVLFETNVPSNQLHVGGTIRFGKDGKMYLSVGDNGTALNSQDLSNPFGKILRFNKDGSIPADNPFYGQAGKYGAIWAYGLRNPFRFQFDSATGRIFEGDVGQATWEELNLITKGADYGWPNCEGMCNTPGMVNPIYTYNHNGSSAAVVGGPVYHGAQFPAAYDGSLFFGDYALGFIKRLTLDANGAMTGLVDFDTSAGSVVDMKEASDGSLYYITFIPGRLYRVTYSLTTQVPKANATADVTKGLDPLTVHFSSAGSSDPAGQPITYQWNFGDGTSSTTPNPTKQYVNKGTYTVELTVSNGTNTAQAVPILIQVGTPPVITIGSPTDGSHYNAGDVINYSFSGVDGGGLDLSDGAFTTEVVFHHQIHIHPFLGPLAGNKTGQFTIPTTGESSPDTWYELRFTATDTNGLSTTKSVSIYPNEVNTSYATSPAGLQILLDDQPVTTPYGEKQVVGFQRKVSTPISQVNGTKAYALDSWSDGGASAHMVTIPAHDISLTGTFHEVPGFAAQYWNTPGAGSAPSIPTIAPTLSRTDAAINFDWSGNSPDPIINSNHFVARWIETDTYAGGTYRYTATADDGVRVYVDNQLIIDKWIDQGATTYTADIALAAGNHTVQMDYYQNTGNAVAKLSWFLVSSTPPPPTTTLLGGMNLSGYCGSIGQTGASLSSTTWTCLPSTTPINMTKACIWQYNDSNATAVQTDPNNPYTWACYTTTSTPPPPPSPVAGYAAQYWNAGTGAQPIFPTTVPTLSRTDTDINFDWGAGSPDPSINVDHFMARWTQTLNYDAATYRFTATADDGVRVYVDNVLLIDKWLDQGATTYTADKVMTAGSHTVKIEYYENAGGAVAKYSTLKL